MSRSLRTGLRAAAATLLVSAFGAILWHGFSYGDAGAARIDRWIDTARDLGTRNVVSAIYLGTRFFDSVLELLVFAVAVLGVRHFLGQAKLHESVRPAAPVAESHVVSAAARLMLPIIVLLGVYLAVHGHLSPGGGFSGGVVAASGLLLAAIAIGSAPVTERLGRTGLERVEWGAMLLILGLVFAPVALALPPFSPLLPGGTLGRLASGTNVLPYNLLIASKVFVGSWTIVQHFLQHRGGI